MAEHFQAVTINIARVNVVGVPGLMLVLVAAAIAVEFPEARWLALSGLAGGVVFGAVLIAIRRARRTDRLAERRVFGRLAEDRTGERDR